MQGKELVKTFKSAAWTQSAQVDQFVGAVGDVPAAEVIKLLEVLLQKPNANEPPNAMRHRCAAFAKLVERSPDPALFVPFARAMKAASTQVRDTLAELLTKVNHIPSHPELIGLLKSNDTSLRKAAARVLSQVGGRTTFDHLRALVRDPLFLGRVEAIDVLMPIAGHYAIPVLGDAIKVGKPNERIHALRVLGDSRYIGKDVPGALAAIKEALPANEPRVVVAAVHAYSSICSEDEWFDAIAPMLDQPNLELVKAAVNGLARFKSLRTIRALEKAFRIGPNVIRMAVLDTAEQIADEAVLPLLVDALNHKHMNIRNKAAGVITQLSLSGKIDVGQTIVWLLRSRDATVRRMAVDIANRVGDRTGDLWPKLLHFLRDEDWWVRERVIDALVEMAGRDLTRHIVAYLQDDSDVVRRYAVGVLMRLKDPSALGALVRTAMNDPDWWVREWALQAMGELGDKRAVPYVLNILKTSPEVRLACIEAIEILDAKEAAPQIAGLLPDEKDADVLLAILKCLAKLDDPKQATHIQQFQNDQDHRLREMARELLVKWNMSQSQWVNQSTIGQTLGLLDQLLYATVRADADDLILAAGRRPMIKRRGVISPLSDYVFREDEVRDLLYPQLSGGQQEDLAKLKDVDFSYEVKSQALRFRANVFRQGTGLSAVFRTIKGQIPDVNQLGLPDVVRRFANLKNGLVLVGGPTGSGKSTTLAALIDDINRNTARHIITLEDPIEVVHARKRCLVTQREIGTHSRSYHAALRATLREDPDVILIGEMRDLPTISFAVSAAETGHLVFGTVHTVSADNSIDRIVNVFPPGQQPQVRSMLAGSLRAVVCQHLLQRIDAHGGRVLAVEVMLNNEAIASLIRKGKTFQIPAVIATSFELGMQSMDRELARLYKANLVSADEVYMKAQNKKDFESLFSGGKPPDDPTTARGHTDELMTPRGRAEEQSTARGRAEEQSTARGRAEGS